MRNNQRIVGKRKQRGYALLLFVLIMMGYGSVALVGVLTSSLSEAERVKFNHNERVLEEAKQALLMHAYNYPNLTFPGYLNLTPSTGPGRLPCPDNDNDGLTDPTDTDAECALVGRFPWAEPTLGFYDAKDASGESLWYAVSAEFRNIDPLDPDAGEDVIVNSESGRNKNNITIVGQGGGIMYSGDIDGVAAVIIAPGAVLARDEDDNGVYEYQQVRGTNAQRSNPRNYMDTFNGFDNRIFNSGQSGNDVDGFILGPIIENDPASSSVNTVVVNDQIIVITTEEVIAMAEKATLGAYKNAINEYLGNTGNVYPWLFNYAGLTIPDDLSSNYGTNSNFGAELATPLIGNIGRIPSINPSSFDDYFTLATSSASDTEISVDFSLTYPNVATSLGGLPVPLNLVAPVFDFQTSNKLTNVFFANLGGNEGRLSGVVSTNETFTYDVYFWDEDITGRPTNGFWTLCAFGGDDLSDCHRNSDGSIPGAPLVAHVSQEEILHVTVEFVFPISCVGGVGVTQPDCIASGGTWTDLYFDTSYGTPPIISYEPADATKHASITGEFAGGDIISIPMTAEYELTDHYHDDELPAGISYIEAGTLNLSDFTVNPLILGLRYYPELPRWAFENFWHRSILMAYSPGYLPGGAASCSEEDGDTSTGAPDDCIVVTNLGGTTNNIVSLLVIAGEHDISDGDDFNDDGDFIDANEVAPDTDFSNDLHDVFEWENYSGIGAYPTLNNDPDPPSDTGLDLVFDRREDTDAGSKPDTVFILQTGP